MAGGTEAERAPVVCRAPKWRDGTNCRKGNWKKTVSEREAPGTGIGGHYGGGESIRVVSG